jgi:hypothetical protein
MEPIGEPDSVPREARGNPRFRHYRCTACDKRWSRDLLLGVWSLPEILTGGRS